MKNWMLPSPSYTTTVVVNVLEKYGLTPETLALPSVIEATKKLGKILADKGLPIAGEYIAGSLLARKCVALTSRYKEICSGDWNGILKKTDCMILQTTKTAACGGETLVTAKLAHDCIEGFLPSWDSSKKRLGFG